VTASEVRHLALRPHLSQSNKKKSPAFAELLELRLAILAASVVNYSLVCCLFFDAFGALDGSTNFEDVADIMHKAQYAH